MSVRASFGSMSALMVCLFAMCLSSQVYAQETEGEVGEESPVVTEGEVGEESSAVTGEVVRTTTIDNTAGPNDGINVRHEETVVQTAAPGTVEMSDSEYARRWLKKLELDITVGWGYFAYWDGGSLEKQAEKIDPDNKDGKTIAAIGDMFLKVLNFNSEVTLHYPISDHYTIGGGIQTKYLTGLYVSVINRLRLPVTDYTAFFFDLPIGINVTKFPEGGPMFFIEGRAGMIIMGTGNLGFTFNLSGESVFLKHEDKYSPLVSIRGSLGMVVTF